MLLDLNIKINGVDGLPLKFRDESGAELEVTVAEILSNMIAGAVKISGGDCPKSVKAICDDSMKFFTIATELYQKKSFVCDKSDFLKLKEFVEDSAVRLLEKGQILKALVEAEASAEK